MRIDVPNGDVADRIAILKRKQRAFEPGTTGRSHVDAELAGLLATWTAESPVPLEELAEWPELVEVNGQLWDVEDRLRALERLGVFDAEFVDLARSVYRLNDRRARLKRAISVETGSALVEEKAYAPYD